jgi:hypothetical protein
MSRIEGVKFEGFRKIRSRSDLNGIQTLKPFPIISFFLFMCHEHYLVLGLISSFPINYICIHVS